MLKCSELVLEIESELDETTGDEADRDKALKGAVNRYAGGGWGFMVRGGTVRVKVRVRRATTYELLKGAIN